MLQSGSKKRLSVESEGGKEQLIPGPGNTATEHRSCCVFGINRPIPSVMDFFRHPDAHRGEACKRTVASLRVDPATCGHTHTEMLLLIERASGEKQAHKNKKRRRPQDHPPVNTTKRTVTFETTTCPQDFTDRSDTTHVKPVECT